MHSPFQIVERRVTKTWFAELLFAGVNIQSMLKISFAKGKGSYNHHVSMADGGTAQVGVRIIQHALCASFLYMSVNTFSHFHI